MMFFKEIVGAISFFLILISLRIVGRFHSFLVLRFKKLLFQINCNFYFFVSSILHQLSRSNPIRDGGGHA